MALITSAVRDKIDVLVEDLRYLTINTRHKHKIGTNTDDDDVIATEKDARDVIDKINKATTVLSKIGDKITTKFNLV